MEFPGRRPPAEAAEPSTRAAPGSQWLEILRTLSASRPDQAPEAWLGLVVVEVQRASERAIGAARRRADELIDGARREALAIRQEGRGRRDAMRGPGMAVDDTAARGQLVEIAGHGTVGAASEDGLRPLPLPGEVAVDLAMPLASPQRAAPPSRPRTEETNQRPCDRPET